ncbi:unnamed protein product [Lathyrus sativus]|nr:unnamed protein product [Lathyrus sativus]
MIRDVNLPPKRKNQPKFKFINALIGEPNFMGVVSSRWNVEIEGRPIQKLWSKLKRLQPIFRGMGRKVSRSAQKIQEYKDKLDHVQQKLNSDMFNPKLINEFKHWTEELLNSTNMEEKSLMQNYKVDWLRLGDGNNAYFHAIMKEKNKQNGLHRLENNQGKILDEFKDIEQEIIQFYQKMIGTNTQTLMHVDIKDLRRGAQLEENHREKLIQQVSEHEILQSLKFIGESKAPGMDGFTSKLFKATWSIIKKYLIKVVLDLFDDKYMYDAVNYAIVTLIPKSTEAKKMKDMRLIASCSTVYKIISKILTNRLSKVINSSINFLSWESDSS